MDGAGDDWEATAQGYTLQVDEQELCNARTTLAVRTLFDAVNRRGYLVTHVHGCSEERLAELQKVYDLLRARPAVYRAGAGGAGAGAGEPDSPPPPHDLHDKAAEAAAEEQLRGLHVPRGKNAPVLPVLRARLLSREEVEERFAAAHSEADGAARAADGAARRASPPDFPALSAGGEPGDELWVVLVRGVRDEAFNKGRAVRVNEAAARAGVRRLLVLTERPINGKTKSILYRRRNGVCGEEHVIHSVQNNALRHMLNDYGAAHRVVARDSGVVREALRRAGSVSALTRVTTEDACVGLLLGCRAGMFVHCEGVAGQPIVAHVVDSETEPFLDDPRWNEVTLEEAPETCAAAAGDADAEAEVDVEPATRLPRTRENLLAVLRALPPFEPDGRSRYHHMLSLILSQRVRFTSAQRTRSRLYTLLGEDRLDSLFERLEERPDFVERGKWETMRAVHEAWPNVEEVSGVGAWTLACAHHMAGDHEKGGFVRGDRAVQRVSAALFAPGAGVAKILPRAEAGELFARLWQLTRASDEERAVRVTEVLRRVRDA